MSSMSAALLVGIYKLKCIGLWYEKVESSLWPLCSCVPVCCTPWRSQRLQCHRSGANREEQRLQRQRRVRLLSWESLLCGGRTRETGLAHQHEGRLQRVQTSREGCGLLKRRWQVQQTSVSLLMFGRSGIWDHTLCPPSLGTCVSLRTTARCITVRGGRPSSTCLHVEAWARPTDWCLCCRASFRPCWSSWRTLCEVDHQVTAHSEKNLSGEFNQTTVLLIHSFIYSKFQEKKENTRNSQIHIWRWHVKNTPSQL